MKKFIILAAFIVFALVLAACGTPASQEYTAIAESPEDTPNDALTPAQMQHDPMSFSGQISVIGYVGGYGRFNFSLSYDSAFELPIDYRGTQAMPGAGTKIMATGRMNYRRCCGPHLIATSFEVVE